MKFEAVKCDECGRIQGESNHWIRVQVWPKADVVALGEFADLLMGTSDMSSVEREEHDLCGQGCAIKHIAALLKWNMPTEAA